MGLTTAVGLCKLGHTVRCADIDEEKIAALRAGRDYMGEPGMEELLTSGLGREELVFSTTPEVLRGAEIIFICVGTPSLPDGAVDLACVRQAAGPAGPPLAWGRDRGGQKHGAGGYRRLDRGRIARRNRAYAARRLQSRVSARRVGPFTISSTPIGSSWAPRNGRAGNWWRRYIAA